MCQNTGPNLADPRLWFLQVRAFDKRPQENLPEWWKQLLRDAGGWDDETQSLALNRHQEPLWGPPIIDRSAPID